MTGLVLFFFVLAPYPAIVLEHEFSKDKRKFVHFTLYPKNTVIFNTDGEAAAARQSTTAATPESSKEDNIPTVVSAEAKSKAKNTSPSKTTLGLSRPSIYFCLLITWIIVLVHNFIPLL